MGIFSLLVIQFDIALLCWIFIFDCCFSVVSNKTSHHFTYYNNNERPSWLSGL